MTMIPSDNGICNDNNNEQKQQRQSSSSSSSSPMIHQLPINRHNNNNTNNSNQKNHPNTKLIHIENIEFVDYEDESQLDHVMSLVGRDLSEPYSIFTYRYFLYRFPRLCILAIDSITKEPIGCVVGKIDEEEVVDCIVNEIVESHNDDHDHFDNIQENETSIRHEEQQYPENTTIISDTIDHNLHDESSNDVLSSSTIGSGAKTRTAAATTPTTTATRTTSTITQVGYIGMLAVSEQYRRKGIGKALVQRILYRMKYELNCTSATLETEVTNVTAQQLYQNYFGFIREELLVRYYLNWNDAYRLRLWF